MDSYDMYYPIRVAAARQAKMKEEAYIKKIRGDIDTTPKSVALEIANQRIEELNKRVGELEREMAELKTLLSS